MWAVHNALWAMGQASPEQIAPHVDDLVKWLKHEDWWFPAAAMVPLAKVVDDKAVAEKILPIVGKIASTNTHVRLGFSIRKVFEACRQGSPAVRTLAVTELCDAYQAFPKASQIHGPDQISMLPAEKKMLLDMARFAAALPGGLNALYPLSRERFPDQDLPHGRVYLKHKSGPLKPEIETAVQKYKDYKNR